MMTDGECLGDFSVQSDYGNSGGWKSEKEGR